MKKIEPGANDEHRQEYDLLSLRVRSQAPKGKVLAPRFDWSRMSQRPFPTRIQ